ncbi:MAG: hypothetical protein AOA65_2355 [Candidatus Bathyarchaeota archaeon BA1]|nr:MAG: hypothetical protein AOA65_2355 [Candidatus Bathyarchaeota archaeon BA1]
MPAKKMRVDIFDESGNRYTVTFEGQVTRDKAIRLLDLVELLGGMPGINPEWSRATSEASKFDKIRSIIDKHFPMVWFSSKDVRSLYEQELKEPISLSTVSTYLSRMADRGVLVKSGPSISRRYRMMTEVSQRTLSFIKSNK